MSRAVAVAVLLLALAASAIRFGETVDPLIDDFEPNAVEEDSERVRFESVPATQLTPIELKPNTSSTATNTIQTVEVTVANKTNVTANITVGQPLPNPIQVIPTKNTKSTIVTTIEQKKIVKEYRKISKPVKPLKAAPEYVQSALKELASELPVKQEDSILQDARRKIRKIENPDLAAGPVNSNEVKVQMYENMQDEVAGIKRVANGKLVPEVDKEGQMRSDLEAHIVLASNIAGRGLYLKRAIRNVHDSLKEARARLTSYEGVDREALLRGEWKDLNNSIDARWGARAVNSLGKTVVALNESFVRLESLLNEIYAANNESAEISHAKINADKEAALAKKIADLQKQVNDVNAKLVADFAVAEKRREALNHAKFNISEVARRIASLKEEKDNLQQVIDSTKERIESIQ